MAIKLKFLTSILPFMTLFWLAEANALTIVPYFTPGGVPGATTSLSGPKPALAGDTTGYAVDCAQMPTISSWISSNPGIEPQTIAVCNSIKQLEAVLTDPVTVKIEFFNILAVGPLATTISKTFLLTPGDRGKSPLIAYSAVWQLLVKDNNKDPSKYDLINHLPTVNQFHSTNVSGSDFTPRLAVTSAQFKSLGVNIDETGGPVAGGLLPNMDAGVRVYIVSPGVWDYDQSDNIGIGPLSQMQWEAPNTLITVPTIYDFTGTITHEIGHSLGMISRVDNRPSAALPNITIVDLFRLKQTDLPNINKPSDFTQALRNLVSLPVDNPADGNHVFVYDIKNGAAQYVPLSCGVTCDGTQSSHTRTQGYGTFEGGDVLLHFIDQAFLDVTGPTGTLMTPGLLPNEVSVMTIFDLTVFDVIGWNANVSQLNAPTVQSTAKEADSYDIKLNDFLNTNDLKSTIIEIEDN